MTCKKCMKKEVAPDADKDPKYAGKKLLLGKKKIEKLREHIGAIKEFIYGASWVGRGVSGGSYPGPEPGKVFSTRVALPPSPKSGMDARKSKSSPKTSGRQQDAGNEDNRQWRRKV